MKAKIGSVLSLAFALMVVPVLSAAAQSPEPVRSPFALTMTVTWDLGLRVGVAYRPWDHVGFRFDVGSTLFSFEGDFAVTGDAFVVVHALPPGDRFQIDACLGIPDWRVVFADPRASEIAPGASIEAGWRLSDSWDLFLRAGGGVPFFAEGTGPFVRQPVSFPLGLWPDLSAGAKWYPR